MTWVHLLTNDKAANLKLEDNDSSSESSVKDFNSNEETNEETDDLTYEECMNSPDIVFDRKYGEQLYDILWSLKEFNKDVNFNIKFNDFGKMIGELYEQIKELSSSYYEESEEEEDELSDSYEDDGY